MHSHHTARSTATRIARLQRVGVAALTEIILPMMDNDGAPDDRVGAKEADRLVCERAKSACISTTCAYPLSGWMTTRAAEARTGDVHGDVPGRIGVQVTYPRESGMDRNGKSRLPDAPRSPTCLSESPGAP